MLLNTEEVKRILPHRDPFLFIDQVEKIEHGENCYTKHSDIKQIDLKTLPGALITANYFTNPDHSIFKGHFPNYPILPGVVQVEMMAQATSFMVMLVYPDPFSMKMDVALLAISEAKFRKPVLPNMHLTIKTKVEKIRGTMVTCSCQLWNDTQLVSEASVLATLRMS